MSKPRHQASDTVTLMLSLVPFLQKHSPISVDETAQHFREDRHRVVEAVNLLVMTGVPDREGNIYSGEMFDIDFDLYDDGAGEISLTNSVVLDGTPKLSSLEAASILVSLNTMLAASPESSAKHGQIRNLIHKVRSGSVSTSTPLSVVPVTAPEAISIAVRAIDENRQLAVTYQNAAGLTQGRLLDPLQVTYVGQSWFLRAWCHLRNEQRTFRGDRILSAEIETTPRCNEHTNVAIVDELFTESDSDIVAQVRVPTWVLPRIAEYGPQIVELNGNLIDITIRLASVSSGIALVSRLPGLIEVIEPLSLVREIAQWAQRAR